jgi:hypothetical protein
MTRLGLNGSGLPGPAVATITLTAYVSEISWLLATKISG